MEKDPLDTLFVKPSEIIGEQRVLLAKLVGPFAAIDEESGRVHFKADAENLSNKRRILVYLLACLALAVRSGAAQSAAVSPKKIEEALGLPGGTVRPRLQELVASRIVIKTGGEYAVDSTTLQRAAKELESLLP